MKQALPSSGAHRWLLILTLLLAFAFRTCALSENPPGLSGDEGIEGSDALSIGPGNWPLYFPANYGREPLYMYLLALGFKAFGVSTFTLRYPGVLCSLLTLALAYALLKRLWDRRTAWFTLSLLTVSFWPVFIGRVGLRAVTMPPLQVLALYALERGRAEGRYRWWALLGLCLGLGMYTYIPARVFPALPLLWLSVNSLFGPADWRAQWRRTWSGVALAALVGMLVFAPLGGWMLRHPDVANQRLEGVGGPLQALLSGDPRPTLANLAAVSGMVLGRGDPLPRYNLPGRPVFEWPLGLLCYAGLLLCLLRWREPRANLLLLWGGLMLTPTLLSADAPSFLRSAGAMVPFYAMPALALSASAARMTQRRARQIGYAIGGALLLAHAWGTGDAYFIRWPAYPGVSEIYGDRLVQLGRALDARLPLPAESQVVVVCYYATDVCRDMLRMQTHYRGPLRAVAGYAALVFPAQPPTGDLVYLFGHALPLAPNAARLLQAADVEVLDRSAAGAPQAAVYHLRAAVRQALTPAHPLAGGFQAGDGVRLPLALVGSDLPAAIPRGATRNGLLYWQALATDAPASLRWELALVDAEQNTWTTTSDALPYPPQEWRPGDLVVQELPIAIPLDAPPGPFSVTFGLFDAGGPLLYVDASDGAGWVAPLGTVQATGQPTVTRADAGGIAGSGIALIHADARDHLAPGETLDATLYWQALTAPAADYAVAFSLYPGHCTAGAASPGATPAFTTRAPLWAERHPTSRWLAGETVRSYHAPTAPATLPNGDYALTVALAAATPLTPTLACLPVTLEGRARVFTPPAMQVSAPYTLADGVALLGYRLDPAGGSLHVGQTLAVTLYWQAQATPSQDYVVFVHLYRAGQMAGQHDGAPCGGACSARTWLPGEVLSDTHTLALNPATPPGDYALNIGLYNPQTLERLPIPGAAEAQITLQSLHVE